MTSLAAAGALKIDIVTADDRVCSAAIHSGRPVGLGRLFAGRVASEAPILSRRLFTLCANAQAAASEMAVAAANGDGISEVQSIHHAIATLAERVFETLRACVVGWPWGGSAPMVLARASEALRGAASASRVLAANGSDAREALGKLKEASRSLGAPERPEEQAPAAETAFGIVFRHCRGMHDFVALRPDALTRADDTAVAAAWAGAPLSYASTPALPGRTPEAGAYARLWTEIPPDARGLSGRLIARLIDIRTSLEALGAILSNGSDLDCAGFATGRVGGGIGYGAVETARGRLYHFIDLEQDRRIRTYGIVAPTEWNFHGSGPFVASLLGARVGHGEAAKLDVARRATLFDPCVAFDVTIRETVHA